eukprot:1141022-Pelagomonas_calceolata.AAC.5
MHPLTCCPQPSQPPGWAPFAPVAYPLTQATATYKVKRRWMLVGKRALCFSGGCIRAVRQTMVRKAGFAAASFAMAGLLAKDGQAEN